jgi:hypothetical protein
MIQYFRKNMSKIPGDNGSSLKKLITIKIITLTNITLIETSVSVVYLLVYFSIYYPPLLCTSCDVSKICLPPIYNPIAFSPDDQIQPKLFVLVNSRNTFILSHKFVLDIQGSPIQYIPIVMMMG